MRQIWKYPLPTDDVRIVMPTGSQVLCCQVQNALPCIWALVNTQAPETERRFRIYGTGHQVQEFLNYVGTFQLADGALVFHVVEVTL